MAEKWTLGGYHTDTLSGKTVKTGLARGNLNGSGACMQVLGVDYQVTAGKTFRCVGVGFCSLDASVGSIVLRYADNAAMTTNPVAMGFEYGTDKLASVPVLSLFGITAPAGKYVGIFNAQNSGISHLLIYGYEE